MTNINVVYVVVCFVRHEGESIYGIYDNLELAQDVAQERNTYKYTPRDTSYSVVEWGINTTRQHGYL